MAANPTVPDPVPDGQLLAQFARSGEQESFEQIVNRHATLVLSVCRGVLGGAGAQHDAEDAAQATFLTLANKAGSLSNYESVAGWLYRVAWHISKRSRAARELRTRRERSAAEGHFARLDESASGPPALVEALHEELHKLPEKYRLPLILHHLEGWTEPEIAKMLDARVGTISSRISRGRQMLRDRMAKHGRHLAVVTAATVGTALADQAKANAVAPALQQQLVAVGSVASPISPSAAALSHGAMSMLRRQAAVTFASWAGVAITTVVAVSAIVSTMLNRVGETQFTQIWFPSDSDSGVPATRPVIYDHPMTRMVRAIGPKNVEKPTAFGEVAGRLTDERGLPVADARVRIYYTSEDVLVNEPALATARTEPDGSFVLKQVPVGEKFYITCVARNPSHMLEAQADIGGVGANRRTDAGTIRLDPPPRRR